MCATTSVISLWLALASFRLLQTQSFSLLPRAAFRRSGSICDNNLQTTSALYISSISDNFKSFQDDGDDNYDDEEDEEDDDEDEEKDPYTEAAASEFLDEGAVSTSLTPVGQTSLDWGGEYGKLRERIEDSESGEAQNPSKVLFRIMTSETPNQAIRNFVSSANPQVVAAMSGAVQSLLGGLSNPMMGIETVVKSSGEKIGNLCFQLQMTGYMFRNAEYVLALKDLMNLKGKVSLEAYREAFDRLDRDGSGYIDVNEIEQLMASVYNGKVPSFEIESFLAFFDSNNDGKISWEEFERGLGAAMSRKDAAGAIARANGLLLPADMDDDDGDDDDGDDIPDIQSRVSGMIEIELEDGEVIEVEAQEYLDSLRDEAKALQEALRRESAPMGGAVVDGIVPSSSQPAEQEGGELGIAGYIASRQGDVKALTEGVSPEIIETMRMLVDFVLEGGNPKNKDVPKDQIQMEIPGSALQQLALWQLVLGYKLRESEATGDYLKLLK